jgi:integrase
MHDLRPAVTTTMRRNKEHSKVVSGILGHSKVALAMNVYDHLSTDDMRGPLERVAGELLRSVTKTAVAV